MSDSYLGAIFDGILALVLNPFVKKMVSFSLFFKILTDSINFFKDLILPHVVNNPLLAIPAYFGLLDGISLYITIVLAGFGVKQVLSFLKS